MQKYVNLLVFFAVTSVSATDIWTDIGSDQLGDPIAAPILPQVYRSLSLDVNRLKDVLGAAPEEGTASGSRLALPTPDGDFETFVISNSPVMEPALAARYPEITTYVARSLVSGATARLDFTPHGFHAMVRGMNGSWFIDPFIPGLPEGVISYFKKDLAPTANDFQCLVDEMPLGREDRQENASLVPLEGELLTYRCVIACTGEYATFHGGTVELALAAVVTALNRVNEVYEIDAAIRMILVADNDQVIYTNGGTDPYTNSSGSTMLGQNQANVDAIIGNGNYDIGHVFSTGGGGIAGVGVICNNGRKAQGVTGLNSPTGDPFYIDYVAHEMGHQHDGLHTWNACPGSAGGTAYEPGSASTIMGYAGICGSQNLQPNSDPYFHVANYDEIRAYTRTGTGSTCGITLVVANEAPTVDAGGDYTIPQRTPFALTGSATDPNDDTLTYCWEQFDLGPSLSLGSDNGLSPIFRSWNPSLTPTRTFPRLANLLNNTLPIGEILPSTNRSLNFRMTVRDNHPGGGGVDFDSVLLTVTTDSGPFLVTSPNTAVNWMGGDSETVTWDVAATDSGAVSCGLVDILLSTDGGLSYTETLANGTANDGNEPVTVPNLDTLSARVKVVCSDNIFFDISNINFTVESAMLFCTTAYENWQLPTDGVFLDSNGNGVVDVADLISCLD